MKNIRFLFIISIAALPLLCGCPEHKDVTTKINRDGSCIRAIGEFDPRSFKGVDSVIHDLPIPIDHSWKLKYINDSTAVLIKEFETVEDLNSLFASDESELKAYKRKVELTEKFRWFHTIIQYRETYEGLLTEVPLTDYMSEAEAETFKSDDSKVHPIIDAMEPKSKESLINNIEERFGYWLNDNIYSLAYDDIVEIADSLGLFDNKSINVAEMKDTVKQRIDEAEKRIITFNNSDDEMDMVDLADLMGKEMGLDSVLIKSLKLKVMEANLEEKYENEIFSGFTKDYDNGVIMPGLVTDTNAELLAGDTLIWDVESIKFCDSDFVMFAESKVTNRWAYILSGFIVLVALISPFLKRLKKQQG